MPTLAKIMRILGFSLFIFIFTTALQFAVFFVPTSLVLQRDDAITSWLEQGQVYERFPTVVAEQLTAKPAQPGQDEGVGVETEELEKVVREAFPPEVLSEYGQRVADGIYAWLRGESDKPEFLIDLEERRPQIESSIGNLIIEKLANAPVCGPQVDLTEYDPLNDGCLPKGQSAENVANQTVAKLFAGEGGLGNLSLDSEKVFADTELDDHPAKRLYGALGPIRIGLLLAVLIPAALAVWLSPSWRQGLRRISWISLTTSLFAAGGVLLLTQLLPSAINRATLDAGNEQVNLSGLVIPVISAALGDIGRTILLFVVPLFLLSLGTLIWLHYSGRTLGAGVKPKQPA